MRAFVIRRLLQAVLVIFLVVTLVFFLIRVSGDPASLGVNLDPNRDPEEIQEEYQEIRRKMGLDKHPIIQYFVFWQRTLQLGLRLLVPLRRAHDARWSSSGCPIVCAWEVPPSSSALPSACPSVFSPRCAGAP